jgi:hypothetical protein
MVRTEIGASIMMFLYDDKPGKFVHITGKLIFQEKVTAILDTPKVTLKMTTESE